MIFVDNNYISLLSTFCVPPFPQDPSWALTLAQASVTTETSASECTDVASWAAHGQAQPGSCTLMKQNPPQEVRFWNFLLYHFDPFCSWISDQEYAMKEPGESNLRGLLISDPSTDLLTTAPQKMASKVGKNAEGPTSWKTLGSSATLPSDCSAKLPRPSSFYEPLCEMAWRVGLPSLEGITWEAIRQCHDPTWPQLKSSVRGPTYSFFEACRCFDLWYQNFSDVPTLMDACGSKRLVNILRNGSKQVRTKLDGTGADP